MSRCWSTGTIWWLSVATHGNPVTVGRASNLVAKLKERRFVTQVNGMVSAIQAFDCELHFDGVGSVSVRGGVCVCVCVCVCVRIRSWKDTKTSA